jgi:hypothetical protein
MNLQSPPPAAPRGPGFITVILDIPFSLAIPNGCYTVFDPVKGIAIVQPVKIRGPSASGPSASGPSASGPSTSRSATRVPGLSIGQE